jgi:hypothetical protein
MKVPDWWAALLLALAAFRVWRLVAKDDVLDRPRRWLLRLGNEWQGQSDPIPRGYRSGLADFLTCPWCLGFWIVVAEWVLWQVWPHATLVVAAPLAVMAVAALVASNLDPDDS